MIVKKVGDPVLFGHFTGTIKALPATVMEVLETDESGPRLNLNVQTNGAIEYHQDVSYSEMLADGAWSQQT